MAEAGPKSLCYSQRAVPGENRTARPFVGPHELPPLQALILSVSRRLGGRSGSGGGVNSRTLSDPADLAMAPILLPTVLEPGAKSDPV